MQFETYIQNRNGIETGDYTTPWGSSWKNPRYLDEWKTGYFNVPKGEWRLMFVTGDLLSTAVDDIVMMPGMCEDVCKLKITFAFMVLKAIYFPSTFAVKKNLVFISVNGFHTREVRFVFCFIC